MIDFGAVPADVTLPVLFASYGKTNGESITLSGLAVTDIEIYKGVSVTQRASDNGYTLMDTDGIDVDGVTGLHGFSIDLSDNSDAGFYAAGSYYTVVVSTVTIDSQTVTFIAARFRIVLAESVTGEPKVDVGAFGGTAGTFSAGRPEVNASHLGGTSQTGRDIGASVLLSSGTGTGQVKLSSGYVAPNWGDVGNPTTTVGLSGTTVKTATDIATQIAALNNLSSAQAQTAAAAALTSYDPPTRTEATADKDEILAAVAGVSAGSAGDGSVTVTEDYGGANNLRAVDGSGAGINNVSIRVFLTSDYDAGNVGAAFVVAFTTTDVNGDFETPLSLDPGDYTLLYTLQEAYINSTKLLTVT